MGTDKVLVSTSTCRFTDGFLLKGISNQGTQRIGLKVDETPMACILKLTLIY